VPLSNSEYSEIIQQHRNGKLTIMIDTPGFRRVIYRTDPDKLGRMVGRPVSGAVKAIKLLSIADTIALLITSCFAIPAFGLWALLVIPTLLIAHTMYKGYASRGRQSVMGVSVLLVLALVGAVAWPDDSNIWIRIFIVSGALAFFLTRLLYVVTSRFVFSLAHSSYEFFATFYKRPEGALIPLLWTDPDFARVR
jgi:hypothetical protein